MVGVLSLVEAGGGGGGEQQFVNCCKTECCVLFLVCGREMSVCERTRSVFIEYKERVSLKR